MKNKSKDMIEAAEKWVFETNGSKWSNNDDTAGDNYGSFIAGYKLAQEILYSEEEVLKMMEDACNEMRFQDKRADDMAKEIFEYYKKK